MELVKTPLIENVGYVGLLIPDRRGKRRTSAGSDESGAYRRTGIGKGASYLVKRDCMRCADSTSSGAGG
jgi:hypothetical protein